MGLDCPNNLACVVSLSADLRQTDSPCMAPVASLTPRLTCWQELSKVSEDSGPMRIDRNCDQAPRKSLAEH